MNKIFLQFIALISIPLMFATPSIGQTNDSSGDRTDSLFQAIKEEQNNDSLVMDAYFNLGRIFRSAQPALALNYAESSLHHARKLGYSHLAARALNDKGYLQWRLGNFSEAMDYLEEALEISKEEGNLSEYARTLNIMGAIYSDKGFNEKALECYYNALTCLKEIDSVARTAAIYNNIALIFLDDGNYERSEEYNFKSLAIKEDFNNRRGIAFSLNNLGTLNKKMGNYQKALEFFEASLEYWIQHDDQRGIAKALQNMGNLYFREEKHAQAIATLKESHEIYAGLEDLAEQARIDHSLGQVYLAMGSLSLSEAYFEQSMRVAETIEMHTLVLNNCLALSDVMAKKGQFESAYQNKSRYLVLRDSLYDAEGKQRIMEMQMMYDRERKTDEIKLLRKTNRISELSIEKERLLRNFLLTFIILILIILIITYNRFVAYKKTNILLNAQQEKISRKNKLLKELNKSLLEQNIKVDELNKELKQSKQKLIDINKTKDQFFSIISHDLRSPFASIVSFSRIMKRDINNLSKDELQQLASELDKSVIKINNLLDNLLQWSRSQTGKLIYQPRAFVLKDIVNENINLFKANARDKQIDLNETIDANIEVWADPNMVDTIIRNLVSNALKYTEAGGSVTVGSRISGDMAEISVSDTGVGISESDQQKLFRVDKLHSTFGTNDEKGSGLGLLLCKDFVKKQGGEMTLSSTPGEGSVFIFTIPLNITE